MLRTNMVHGTMYQYVQVVLYFVGSCYESILPIQKLLYGLCSDSVCNCLAYSLWENIFSTWYLQALLEI